MFKMLLFTMPSILTAMLTLWLSSIDAHAAAVVAGTFCFWVVLQFAAYSFMVDE